MFKYLTKFPILEGLLNHMEMYPIIRFFSMLCNIKKSYQFESFELNTNLKQDPNHFEFILELDDMKHTHDPKSLVEHK
jgi:hypothetical protein